MVPDPFEQFFQSLKRSELIPEGELASFSDEIKLSGVSSREEIAARLVEKNVLTPYQAERILQDQGEDCVLAGRYHILEKIGAGGMGNVFRALDIKLNRVVAVKLMTPHNLSDPDAVTRFKREARALAQLALPNVVQAFDTGEDRGRNFLVMEYVQGISLSQLVKDKGPVPPSVAADYVYQTALGMQRAHERGLVHRDIKPANFLLTGDGEIKILDLGLARFLQDQIPDGELTRENIGMGTPDYMPPEQFRDAHNVDLRADIYSLGCTLYFLIAGQVPFPGSSLSEKAHAHQNKEPVPLEERCPEIPAGLAMIVTRMMAKHPADRFQSMRAVAEALAQHVAGSSKSSPSIKMTVSWNGDALVSGKTPRRASWLPWTSAGVAFVGLIGALAVLGPSYWNPPTEKNADEHKVAQVNDEKNKKVDPGKKEPEKKQTKDEKKSPPIIVPKKEKTVKIDDGLTVAQDGTGDCKTINEALKTIKPGQRILVLDDKVYEETILLNDSERHKGITLEAKQNATIEFTGLTPQALLIEDVTDVKVTGFKFRASKDGPTSRTSIVILKGKISGVRLEGLDVDTPQKLMGISVVTCSIPLTKEPVTIKNCRIKTEANGIVVSGMPALPTNSVMICDNTIHAFVGIHLEFRVSRVQITGNQVTRDTNGGASLNLSKLMEQSKDILIANNTLMGGLANLQVIEDAPPKKRELVKGQVTFRGNILFRAGVADMIALVQHGENIKPQDGKFLEKLWTFDHNFRDLAGAAGLPIPPKALKDERLDEDDFASLNSTNSQFLQPKERTALATGGAGKMDPAFPVYAGANPPVGMPRWQWKWAWDAESKKR